MTTLSGPHFITTTPNLIYCQRQTCRRPVLAATIGGLDRHVDPTPLTEVGELAALVAGRPTYNLAGGMADHLIRRTVHHINTGARDLPVLAEHHCTPPEPAHVDHSHLEAATGLVTRLLGGEPVEDASEAAPPF